MEKNLVNRICYSIVLGFVCLGIFTFLGLKTTNTAIPVNALDDVNNRYELISHGNVIYLFDKQTGEFWEKFSSSNEGPKEWQKCESPLQ